MSSRQKIVVAMSGGVDSSVAAALLLREGYDVIGVFMRLGSPKGVEAAEPEVCEPVASGGKSKQGCCSVLDADDARRVAGMLDIPFYVLNFQEDFGRVIEYFVDEYNRPSGRGSRADEGKIRTEAVTHRVTLITTLSAAYAAICLL